MEYESFNINCLTEELGLLPLFHRVAFAGSCCERLFPNYVTFSQVENWGNPGVFRQALDTIWKILEIKEFDPKKIRRMIEECDEAIPDTEDFGSLLVSLALDAGAAITETMQCLLDGDAQHAAAVGNSAHDTVYMFIQCQDNMEYSDPNFEERINSHPLMIRELQKQSDDLKMLEGLPVLDSESLNSLRHSFQNSGKSNIDLG